MLGARPDAVLPPEPRTLGEVAERLERTGSVAGALSRLPLPCLQVVEAVAALGTPLARGELESLLGVGGERLEWVLRTLADHALVWPGDADGELHASEVLLRAWEAPLGLGPGLEELLSSRSAEELRRIAVALGVGGGTRKRQRLDALLAHHGDPGRLRALIDSAPEDAREVLEQRAGSDPDPEPALILYGSGGPRPSAAERWLLERALLVGDPHGYAPARVPAEVVLALRGPDWCAPFDPEPPVPEVAAVTGAEVEREAAASATAFAEQAAALLAACADRPLAALKSGGVGVRELTRVGRAVRCEEPVVRLVLECAYAAGLVAYEGGVLPVTEAYDAWAEREPAERYVSLVEAWWRLGFTASASRGEEGKALPAVGRAGFCAGCRAAKEGLLVAASALPEGVGVRDHAGWGALVSWYRPFADAAPQDPAPFTTLVREAEVLGLLARGRPAPPGAALLHGDSGALREHAGRLLPGSVGTARVGADLTAVVPGTPSRRLASLLDGLAEREARGTASVWRFTSASLRRALDEGRTAEEIEAGLAEVVEGALPQALTYLIADAARRHGRVRVAPAGCVVHSEDTALIAEIAVRRELSGLGLRRLAPTVLLCRAAPAEALAALRANGYAPAAETEDGAVGVERAVRIRAGGGEGVHAEGPRAAGPSLPWPRRPGEAADARGPAPVADLAGRLLAAPDHEPHPNPPRGGPAYGTATEEILDGYAKGLTLTDVRQLAHALDAGEPVTIEYVAASGNRTVRTVSDLEMDPPLLYAYCHLREDDRVFTLSRIQSVLPVQRPPV